ncbi:SGNH/GDSL hydrolase family protein [Shewanella sp. 4_MG-2023]|uniref:SGNH/GDSL hydrolase family protein n=1 Tax=Shewanella sp. 4_MG-2023 TaxID=3062652 RepID=UPI0026E27F6C|nr:SGNH/GDSL hydrolase family protein [Shewanella sp. 4_MG-2023]MDO6678433.1 SGNH/GDSL hydrolase family protein [Shewanella sp. 4_MG-2023]
MNFSNVSEPKAQYLPNKVILLGDSIFDNAPYVEATESVAEQLQTMFGDTAKVELLAVDGHVMANIPSQLEKVKQVTSVENHVFISCGGNDLLGYKATGLMSIKAVTIGDALISLHQVRESFRIDYQNMLDAVQCRFAKPVICTIYDSIPNLSYAEQVAIGIFNEVILREAAVRKLEVLDLRTICDECDDFASISPIEPSNLGARKIALAILDKCNQKQNELNMGCV